MAGAMGRIVVAAVTNMAIAEAVIIADESAKQNGTQAIVTGRFCTT